MTPEQAYNAAYWLAYQKALRAALHGTTSNAAIADYGWGGGSSRPVLRRPA